VPPLVKQTSAAAAGVSANGGFVVGGRWPWAFLVVGVVAALLGLKGESTTASASGSNTLPATAISFSYSAAGRLANVVEDPSLSSSPVAKYGYDGVGNITSIARTAVAVGSVTTQGFSPTVGPVGSKVWLLGTAFSATPAQDTVKFNGTTATVVDASNTQVVAVVPAGATTGTISIATPSGTATTSSTFTVAALPAPTISGLSASIAAVGTSVTITGTNFSTTAVNNLVAANGIRGKPSTATATSIAVPVPSNATSGPITVATANGSATSSADLFVPPLKPDGTGTFAVSDVGWTGRTSVGGTSTVSTANSKIGLDLFNGTQGERVAIEMSAVTGINSLASVSILDPTGRIIASHSVQSPGFMDTFTLPVSGSYTLLSPAGNACPCSITYRVVDVPADISDTITPGTAKQETFVEGQNANLTFSTTAGHQISVQVNSTTLPGIGTIRLLDPLGAVIAHGGTSVGASIGSTTVSQTGQYTLGLDPSGTDTGTLSVTVTDTGGGAAPRLPTRLRSIRTGPLYPDWWRPTPGSPDWYSHRGTAAATSLAPLRAARGVTALSGQVLTIGGAPLAGASVTVGRHLARTDATGRFIVRGLTAGWKAVDIDATSVHRGGESFGSYTESIRLRAGQTTTLAGVVWMTALDTAHAVTLHYPLSRPAVVKSPYIPGLELRIPAGSTLTGTDGKPVTSISITPMPVDRTPFPPPGAGDFPIFFTIQPTGAVIAPKGAQIIYPNTSHASPGTTMPLYQYDVDEHGWRKYGQGRVTASGKQIVFGMRSNLTELTAVDIDFADLPSPFGPIDNFLGGDPVDLGTGLFAYSKTDLVEPGSMPILIGRSYNQSDITMSSQPTRAFGNSMNWTYGAFLYDPGAIGNFDELDLILPSGGRVPFLRISQSTNPDDSVSPLLLRATSRPGTFYGAELSKAPSSDGRWHLRLASGEELTFLTCCTTTGGLMAGEQDRYGNELNINYVNLQQTSIVNSAGRWVNLTWSGNPNGRITGLTDQSGRTVSYNYTTSVSPAELNQVTDLSGGLEKFGWDSSNRIHTITDPRAITYLTVGYDANNKVSFQTLNDNTGSPPKYTFTYSSIGGGNTETDVTDPNQNQTSGLGVRKIVFNSDGFATSDTRAAGTSIAEATTYQRQAGSGLVQSVTVPLTTTSSRTTSYTYDNWGDPLTVTTPNSDGTTMITTQYTYEPQFHLIQSVQDPLSHTVNLAYYPSGHLQTITNALQKTTTYHYDAAGQLSQIDLPVIGSALYGYTLGDLTSESDPSGRFTRQFRDNAGRVVSSTDPTGLATSYAYNSANWLTSATDPAGSATSFAYNANGSLTKITDAKTNITQYTYNNQDLVATHVESHASGATNPPTESFGYDKDGNLTSWTDRATNVTSYQYDALDRRTKIDYTTDGHIDLGYDLGNRLITLNDSSNGLVTRGYDHLDEITSEQTPQGTVGYSYDDAGRRQTMTIGSQTTNYGYDAANQLTSVTRGALSAGIGFDDLGRTQTITLPNGITENYGYDSSSDLTSITYKNGATQIGDLQYAYNDSGQEVALGGSYARVGLPTAVTAANISYSTANRLTKWNGVAQTYDADGHLKTDGTNTYTWNKRQQLTTIKQGATTVETAAYDAFNRRRSATINGTQTQFLYDGWNPIQEQNSTGGVTLNLLSGLEFNQLFATTDANGGNQQDLLTDRLGTTIATADSTGTIQTNYTYEPYGKVTAGGTSANRYRFTGQPDDTTGVQYARDRYYGPSWGRFLSEDPQGPPVIGANLYPYANGDPMDYVDPTGAGVGSTLDDLVNDINWRGGGRKLLGATEAAAAAAGSAVCNTNYVCYAALHGNITGTVCSASGRCISVVYQQGAIYLGTGIGVPGASLTGTPVPTVTSGGINTTGQVCGIAEIVCVGATNKNFLPVPDIGVGTPGGGANVIVYRRIL